MRSFLHAVAFGLGAGTGATLVMAIAVAVAWHRAKRKLLRSFFALLRHAASAPGRHTAAKGAVKE